jgi:hypothetical protein
MYPITLVVLFFAWLFQSVGPALANLAVVLAWALAVGLLLFVVLIALKAVLGPPKCLRCGRHTVRSDRLCTTCVNSSAMTAEHQPTTPGARPVGRARRLRHSPQLGSFDHLQKNSGAGPAAFSAVTKAIIVDEPWIGLILSGQKTWEMRKTGCSYRGAVGLIRKGSGRVVGVARIVDSLSPLVTSEAYAAAEPKHRIPPDRQARARVDGWATPWVLADARRLTSPVPYRHPGGAVIWVKLEPEVTRAIAAQLSAATPTVPSAPLVRPSTSTLEKPEESKERAAIPPSPPAAIKTVPEQRVVALSGGNVRNNHIYLPLDFFPADAIGGGNKAAVADRLLRVEFKPGRVVHADIDGTKRILRDRTATGDFIARSGLKEGDRVVIRRIGAYEYTFERHL